MASVDELAARIRGAMGEGPCLDASVLLDLRGEGVIHVAGVEVTTEQAPADLTVSVSRADLQALGRGELDPVRAMMSGRLKLSDMGLAMKLQPQIQALFARSV
ncbi:MAG: SCP2 sterol-binding domain-containing protein [Phenylobacterium sp.]|uniref:SCP2 sterol-binding domain-containing protein n=1 Tax=Phenylobacterium sp. TaxID=1871053 RepID=UPI0027353D8A|nr:SCP2 sterol-binding domain-containing protein [Phenylobacterium sp.]MDP3173712.1 SCP2 sterol-binding domain-containing protein [Phenylobacterium sp.]